MEEGASYKVPCFRYSGWLVEAARTMTRLSMYGNRCCSSEDSRLLEYASLQLWNRTYYVNYKVKGAASQSNVLVKLQEEITFDTPSMQQD